MKRVFYDVVCLAPVSWRAGNLSLPEAADLVVRCGLSDSNGYAEMYRRRRGELARVRQMSLTDLIAENVAADRAATTTQAPIAGRGED